MSGREERSPGAMVLLGVIVAAVAFFAVWRIQQLDARLKHRYCWGASSVAIVNGKQTPVATTGGCDR